MWDGSLAGRVKEPLCLQRALQRFEFAREKAHPAGSLHGCGDKLIAASRAIEIDATTDNDNLADRWRLFARTNRSAEAHHIEGRLFISKGEVFVAGRAAHGTLHLASNDAIS
jgi:hypothetical protein